MNDSFDDEIEINEPSDNQPSAKEILVENSLNPHVTFNDDPYEQVIELDEEKDPPIFFPFNNIKELGAMAKRHNIRVDSDRMHSNPILNEAKAKLTGISSMYSTKLLTDELAQRENSNWNQYVSHNGVVLGSRRALIKSTDPAIASLRKAFGYTGDIQHPLWRSGIWVTLSEPSDMEWNRFNHTILSAKSELGWVSNGKCFSAFETFHVQAIIAFVKAHIVTTSTTIPVDDLDMYIDMLDIQQLCWIMANTKWPKGFTIRQPCLADPINCNHETISKLKLHRISITDCSKLNDFQRTYMSKRDAKHTPEEVLAYQEQFYNRVDKIDINNVSIIIKAPSARKSADYGNKWISDINVSTTLLFAKTMTVSEQEKFIDEQSTLQNVSSYFQWIDHFKIKTSTDDGDIDEYVDLSYDNLPPDVKQKISQDKMALELIHNGIVDYIKRNILTIIAIPKYPCPKCHGEVSLEYRKHPDIIVLDAINLFFLLGYHHTQCKMMTEVVRK